MAVEQDIPAKGQAPLYTQVLRELKGVYTKSDRTQMPPDHFYDLTNIIPIGPANAHVVPNISAAIHNFSTDVVYFSQYAVLGGAEYQVQFTTNGKIIVYNLIGATATVINPSNLLSGAGSQMTQWMNTYLLFIDSTGYYSWNGSAFTLLNGANQPAAGTAICVYGGRVWVASGRLITFTSAYDGTSTNDPTANTAWLAVNGADFLNMTDPTLTGSITALAQQNGYLYIFGATCIYALSDLYIPYGANPPTPAFTLTMVQGIIGTDQPYSIFAFNRFMMFANRFGAWALNGVEAQKISEDIDGTWQYLSFATPITGGQVVIANILCAAFLVQRLNDPVFGSGAVLAMWFGGKWWFAQYGALTLASTAIIGAVPVLMGFIGNVMYQCFQNTASAPNTRAMTPLWSMDDPLSSKVIIRAGVEVIINVFGGGEISLTADGTQGSTAFNVGANGQITFTGLAGAPITFTGTGPIMWITSNYHQYSGYVPGVWSNYIGMTLTSQNLGFQLASFLLDYKKRVRWGAAQNT